MDYHKFAKPRPNTRFTFVTFASLATREILLTKGFYLDNVFLRTNLTYIVSSESTCCAQSLALTIVVTRINTCYAQDPLSIALHTLMGGNNIIDLRFKIAKGGILNRHDGITTSNVLTWNVLYVANPPTHPILKKLVDFISHALNLDCVGPIVYAKAMGHNSLQQAMAHKVKS